MRTIIASAEPPEPERMPMVGLGTIRAGVVTSSNISARVITVGSLTSRVVASSTIVIGWLR